MLAWVSKINHLSQNILFQFNKLNEFKLIKNIELLLDALLRLSTWDAMITNCLGYKVIGTKGKKGGTGHMLTQ